MRKNFKILEIPEGQYFFGELSPYGYQAIEMQSDFDSLWESLPIAENFGGIYFYNNFNEIFFSLVCRYDKETSSTGTIQITYGFRNETSTITYRDGVITNFEYQEIYFRHFIKDIMISGDPSIFEATELNNIFYINGEKNGLLSFFQRILRRLDRWNKKLDYYLNITSYCEYVDHEIASNYSGVTIAAHAVRLIGNSLNISVRLSLTSTAQNNIGTGNITNLQLCTITIDNIWNDGSPSSNEATNLSQIANASASGSMCSGYSAGNAQPASFHYTTGRSGSTLTISCVLDALYSKTSEMRFTADIPVLRVKSYYH